MRELGIIGTAKETASVDPQFHDKFVEMCALFYTGELTDEEWALLQIHMAYCNECRRTFEQYRHIAKELIPVVAAAAAVDSQHGPYESSAALDEAEAQLISSLGTTQPAPKEASTTKKRRLGVLFPIVLTAFAAIVLVTAAIHLRSAKPQQHPQEETQSHLPALPQTVQKDNGGIRALQQQADEAAHLQQQLTLLKAKSGEADAATRTLQQRLQEEQGQRESMVSERDSLRQQLNTAQDEMQNLRSKLATAETNAGLSASHVAELESRARFLNASLEDANRTLNDKERMLALDKDFLSHDRDIRDVIGARNLYIADIYDTNEAGKTAKPFGRIFYTQDRSLVFYGFDLEHQASMKRSVAFQAWGSGADRQPVSLGLFYQDDGHKRWVLRCNDPKTLARLNMVFVTVEPPGGSSKPTGQQFLRAYLQIQPNHP